jgi:hypothetical protein
VKLLVRTVSLLCLAAILALGAFALIGPQSARVEAREDCASREVPLDEGYGVSRIEVREVCTR